MTENWKLNLDSINNDLSLYLMPSSVSTALVPASYKNQARHQLSARETTTTFPPEHPAPPGRMQHGKSAVLPPAHRLPIPTRQITERGVSRNDLRIFCWDLFDTTHPSPVTAWAHTFLVTQGLRRVAWGTSLLELPFFEPWDLAITTNTKRQERTATQATSVIETDTAHVRTWQTTSYKSLRYHRPCGSTKLDRLDNS